MSASNNVEIERKFLVDKQAFLNATLPDHPQHIISQGYWSSDNLPLHFTQLLEVLKPVVPSSEFAQIAQLGPQGLEARVRQRNDEFFATFKGRTNLDSGGVLEFEYPLPSEPALFLLNATDYRIGKVRHCLPLGDLTLEVDVFEGLDLVLAEVEIPSSDTPLPPLPEWVGEEVTGQTMYMNRTLSTRLKM